MLLTLRFAFYELFTWLLDRTVGRSERVIAQGLELRD